MIDLYLKHCMFTCRPICAQCQGQNLNAAQKSHPLYTPYFPPYILFPPPQLVGTANIPVATTAAFKPQPLRTFALGYLKMFRQLKIVKPSRVYAQVTEFPDAEYANLAKVTCPEDVGDGQWICKCDYENVLVLHSGPHPFLDVKCKGCDKIPDEKSRSTDVLTILSQKAPSFAAVPKWPQFGRIETPYGTVCPCGQSHRTQVYQTNDGEDGMPNVVLNLEGAFCECGKRYNNRDWTPFYIGSVAEYHRDWVQEVGRLVAQCRTDSLVSNSAFLRQPMVAPLQQWVPVRLIMTPPRSKLREKGIVIRNIKRAFAAVCSKKK
jgi:hypothetical protein